MIDTTSEAWRHACEARHVAALPSRDMRIAYLRGVRAQRGNAAADAIKNSLRQMHREKAHAD